MGRKAVVLIEGFSKTFNEELRRAVDDDTTELVFAEGREQVSYMIVTTLRHFHFTRPVRKE